MHTFLNGGGNIRGKVVVIPEPASLALLLSEGSLLFLRNLATWIADNVGLQSATIADSGGGIEELSLDIDATNNIPSQPIFYRIRVEP